MHKIKILIIVQSSIDKSPRSKRILDFCLNNGFEVSLACGGIGNIDKSILDKFYFLPQTEKSIFLRLLYKIFRRVVFLSILKDWINYIFLSQSSLKFILKRNSFDFIYAADILLLPLVAKNKNQAKLIFDAREYYPLQFEDHINFRIFDKPETIRIINKYSKFCDSVYTVSPGLALAYKNNFNLQTKLFYSSPPFWDIEVKLSLRNKIRFLYHGMANRNRKIESYIDLMDLINKECELHLYLVGDKRYIDFLKSYAKDKVNVYFHEPVNFDSIINMASEYDIGLCYFEPVTFNLQFCLPNKFFEYIQARIVVLAGPSPDMKSLIEHYNCGIISKEFSLESLAESINSLDFKDLLILKKNTQLAASKLCFENQEIILRNEFGLNI